MTNEPKKSAVKYIEDKGVVTVLAEILERLGSFKHNANVAINLEQLNNRLDALESKSASKECRVCKITPGECDEHEAPSSEPKIDLITLFENCKCTKEKILPTCDVHGLDEHKSELAITILKDLETQHTEPKLDLSYAINALVDESLSRKRLGKSMHHWAAFGSGKDGNLADVSILYAAIEILERHNKGIK